MSETRWVGVITNCAKGCFGDAITYFYDNTKIALEYSASEYFPQNSSIMQFDDRPGPVSQAVRKWPIERGRNRYHQKKKKKQKLRFERRVFFK